MTNIVGDSNDPNVAAVFGEHTAGAGAVIGRSLQGRGVIGHSEIGQGVWGFSTSSTGVVGESKSGVGTSGASETSTGVWGLSKSGFAVHGQGSDGPGVVGTSNKWVGVYGETAGIENGPAGVWGEHKGAGTGVKAVSQDGVGLAAFSVNHEAVHAETRSPGTAAVAAFNLAPNGTGAALFAKKEGSIGHAGFFDGNVHVTRSVSVEGDVMLQNADCAEDFDIAAVDSIEPGMVMVLGEEGALCPCQQAYDKRVAGVISGAGNFKPGLVLDKQYERTNRKPVALLGKVYCKVDASFGSIEVGDLLTTSDKPGHAMKANDPLKAFGSIIGKALRPLKEGQGLIPILVALQ